MNSKYHKIIRKQSQSENTDIIIEKDNIEDYFTVRNGEAVLWVDTLSKEDVLEIKTAFGSYDRKGNGRVQKNDLLLLMKSLGFRPSTSELQKIIWTLEINGYDCIEYPEFLNIIARKIADTEEDLLRPFLLFDKAGHGVIKSKELQRIFRQVTNTTDDVEDVIDKFDEDCNGNFKYFDFVKAMVE